MVESRPDSGRTVRNKGPWDGVSSGGSVFPQER